MSANDVPKLPIKPQAFGRACCGVLMVYNRGLNPSLNHDILQQSSSSRLYGQTKIKKALSPAWLVN